MHKQITLLLAAAFGSVTIALSTADAGAPAAPLAFTQARPGEFQFDTGVLRGKLRPSGKALGLSSVVYIPANAALDRGDRGYGLFSHYRVFSANKRYGTAAWDWPGTARLRDDGAVEVQWPADKDRPFELSARYRWSSPSALDLETVVKAQQDLPGFEVFLASYFQEQFTNAVVYVRESSKGMPQPGFRAAEKPQGDWQMFPRDPAVLPLINDGRWRLQPNPVNWAILPLLQKPLAVRRAPTTGLTAVLMAPPEDCFTIAMPYQTEGHYSIYLSLFGRDVKSGETARARARLSIAVKPSDQEVLELYGAYLNSLWNKP